MNKNLDNAQHPIRKSANEIIGDVIESYFEINIHGVEYYEVEDKIVKIIADQVLKEIE